MIWDNSYLKKTALKKSDFTERGMKYKNIPPVVNDICDSWFEKIHMIFEDLIVPLNNFKT